MVFSCCALLTAIAAAPGERPSVEEMQKMLPLESKVQFQSGSAWLPAVVKGYQSPGVIRVEVEENGNTYLSIAPLDHVRKPGATAPLMATLGPAAPAPATKPTGSAMAVTPPKPPTPQGATPRANSSNPPGAAARTSAKAKFIFYGDDSSVALSFGKEGRTLMVPIDQKPFPRIWDLTTGKEGPTVTAPGGGRVIYHLLLSPDQSLVAVSKGDPHIDILDAATGNLKRALDFPSTTVLPQLAWSADSKHLIAGRQGVKVLDVETGTEVLAAAPTFKRVNAVDVSPDNKLIAVAGSTGRFGDDLDILDLATGAKLNTIAAKSTLPWMFFLDEKSVLVPWDQGEGLSKVVAMDIASGKISRTFTGPETIYFHASLSSDRKWLASAPLNDDAGILIWDTGTGRVVGTLRQATDNQIALAMRFSPDKKMFAALYSDESRGAVRVWDLTPAGEFVSSATTISAGTPSPAPGRRAGPAAVPPPGGRGTR